MMGKSSQFHNCKESFVEYESYTPVQGQCLCSSVLEVQENHHPFCCIA